MSAEVLAHLQPASGETYLDGTLGGAGHARLILEASAPDGRVVGLDRDPEALQRARQSLARFGSRVRLFHRNFAEMAGVARDLGVAGFDGILLDLGVSSYQLDEAQRGFSFRSDAPLDMRMDPTIGMTAAEVLGSMEDHELARIFRDFGEERFARRIARKIVEIRQSAPILTTQQLADLVRDTVPGGKVPSRIHPATRVFQALRIFVNDELRHIEAGLDQAVDLLLPGGRLVVISFHSLEDRIVKHFFRQEARGCICPPRLPGCVCNHQPRVELLTRKGVRPAADEVEENSRARSAVLRAARRLALP
ncbi:16S rRNA (cytosine1402-N4)-methyltransferase [Geoalkalibacter ferrihydriticus]|nr:16S rRNA (cytosine1402-N4)-methyltransferase [Geoalkalibacter ferrihydriticus]